MSYVDRWFVNDHRSQYGLGRSAITRTSGCTWTAVSNGADAASAGRVDYTPDEVHATLAHHEETNPETPGWSIPDAVEAAKRMAAPLEDRSGTGWLALAADHADGYALIVQGDSDRFGNETCSGWFDGDHAIAVHPMTKVVSGVEYWWINDPICPTGRWERKGVIKAYAEKLAVRCRYGRFVRKVLRLPVPTRPHVVFLPGAVVRIYTLNIAGNIIAYEDRARRWKPSSAPCGLMVVRDTAKPLPPGHARTATVRDGTYKGLTIRVGSAGVYWRS